MNLHHGKIEHAVVRAVIQDDEGIKLQVDVVGLDITALIDTGKLSGGQASEPNRQTTPTGCNDADPAFAFCAKESSALNHLSFSLLA